MTSVAIHKFSGETPRVSPKLLPDNGAQLASNCKLVSGDLEPWKGPSYVNTFGKWVSNADSVVSLHRVEYSGASYWLHWLRTETALPSSPEVAIPVSLFPSPTVDDQYQRIYFNKAGKLYVTTKSAATQGVGTNYPLLSYELGVSAPTDTPAVTAPASVSESQSYAYTFYNDDTLEESDALSPTGTGTGYPLESSGWTVTMEAAENLTESQHYAYSYYNNSTLTESTALSPATTKTGFPLEYVKWRLVLPAAPAVDPGHVPEYPTHRRVYRLDAGAYKLIAELALAVTTLDDTNLALGASFVVGTNFYNPSVAPTVTAGAGPTRRRIYRLDGVDFKRIGETSIGTLAFLDLDTTLGAIYATGSSAYSPTIAPVITPGTNPSPDIDLAYVYTFVSDFGEESAPSAASNIDSGPTPSSSAIWTVAMSPAAQPTGKVQYAYQNIYRTFYLSDGSTEYRFVAQVAYGTTSYPDSVEDGSLLETLPSLLWSTPPADDKITAFTYMGNGVFAILSGQTLRMSEPYQPHSWPDAYARAIGVDGVGLEAIGNSLIVLTQGDPVVFTGTDPSFLSDAKLDINQPCVSRFSVVNVGPAVAYMSPVGYVYAGLGGSQVLTRPLFDKSEWTAINPNSASFATRYDDGLMFFTSSDQFLITPSEQLSILSSLNITEVTALYTDPDTGEVYYVRNAGLYKWEGGTTQLSYLWRSKVFVTPKQINMGVCKIESDAGAGSPGNAVVVHGGLGINESGINGAPLPYETTDPILTFRLYSGDGTLRHTEVITSNAPFRLPSGYKGDTFYFELEGTATVHAVYIAEVPRELKAMGV